MSSLNETPSANRIHIAFFGLRNAGKSTLVNAFTNQNIAIVSDVAGTTTDPVSKAMEILPLGPCLITDTAGLDDVGELGAMRVEKTLAVLATTDVAVWVHGAEEEGLETPQARTHCGTGAGKAVPPEPRPKADAAVRPCVLARGADKPSDYLARRKKFPAGTYGSFFKNPPGDFAGRLLEEVGAKELSVGGASVWSEHANVIVRGAGATNSDVLALARLMRNRVFFRLGVTLECEVRGIAEN